MNAARSGFNEIVLDVKPISGQTLFRSAIAQPMVEWKGVRVPSGYDALAVFLEEAHAEGLAVSASLNVFSEGHKLVPGVGAAYTRPDWQMVAYSASRWLTLPGGSLNVDRWNSSPAVDQAAVFTNGTSVPAPSELADRAVYVCINHLSQVTGISHGSMMPGGTRAPQEGYLVVGVGSAADRLRNLNLGATATFAGQPSLKRIADADSEGWALFVNPLHPEVRSREIGLMRELVSRYPIDGIVLDRMRHSNIQTDFSDITRQAFEMRYGRIVHFPQDILEISPQPGRPVRQGRLFPRWMEFRASVIRDFLAEAVRAIRSVRSDIPIGAYVGSWYDSYYDVGVNWASDEIDPPYDWASGIYRFTGYAEFLDYLMTGCYYRIPFAEDAPLYDADEGATVESAARRSVSLAGDSTFVYGSIYLNDYANDPQGASRAVQAAMESSAGVMVFDASYMTDRRWWDAMASAFKGARSKAPHHYPSLVESLRLLRDMSER